jgi:hypothetical protein
VTVSYNFFSYTFMLRKKLECLSNENIYRKLFLIFQAGQEPTQAAEHIGVPQDYSQI